MTKISKELIGFEAYLKELTNNIIKKNLSNSLIFYGNQGIGKATFSYKLINTVFNSLNENSNLTNQENLIYNNSHPNLIVIHKELSEKKDVSRNFIIIEQIRKLESYIYQSSFNNMPKFIIIDSADDLNINSANAILKILEEPKENTYFILISHQLSKLLPTITSRCIKFKFNNPSFEKFNKIVLNVEDSIESLNLDLLYDLSNGSPGLALQLYFENFNQIFDHLYEIIEENKSLSSNILNLSNFIGNFNNDQFKVFLSLIKFIFINITKINLGIKTKDFLISDLSKSLYNLSKKLDNKVTLKILTYLSNNEKDLFTFNLDKKVFILNMFSHLSKI